jgi:hypothetical protein
VFVGVYKIHVERVVLCTILPLQIEARWRKRSTRRKEGPDTRFAAILMTYITFYTRRGPMRPDASLRDKLPDCNALQYVTHILVSLLPTIGSTATRLHRSNKYVLHYVKCIHISRLGTLSNLSQTQLVCHAQRFHYKLLPSTLPEILGQST